MAIGSTPDATKLFQEIYYFRLNISTCFTSVIMVLQTCGVKPDGFSASEFSTTNYA